nr:hypothetical protein [Acinetobacter vivianii]
MLKEIIVIDYQGNESKAQAYFKLLDNSNQIRSKQVQESEVVCILIKGELIYPSKNWVFYSSAGNSYYIK